jgi:hypothetical protein
MDGGNAAEAFDELLNAQGVELDEELDRWFRAPDCPSPALGFTSSGTPCGYDEIGSNLRCDRMLRSSTGVGCLDVNETQPHH